MNTIKPAPLSLAICLALSQQAIAEQATERKVYSLDKVTVAATLTEQSLENVANSVSVLSSDDIEKINATTIENMVRYETGVAVGSQGGQGARFGLKGFNIRGIDENRVKIMVDGISQADAFVPAGSPYQRAGRNYIDIDSMKQIEILKGPASSLYGSDAIGGAVSFSTKDPADYLSTNGDDTSASIKVQHTSADDALSETLTLANRTGNLDSLLVYTHRDAHEQENHGDDNVGGTGAERTKPDPVDYDSDNLLVKLQYQLNDEHRIGLVIEDFESFTKTDVQSKLSGSYSDYYVGKDTVSRQRYGIFHAWQADNSVFDSLRWSLDKQTSESDQDTHHVYQSARRIKDYLQEEESLNFSAQFNKQWQQHEFTYGFNYEDTDTTNVTDTLYLDTPASNTYDRYIPLIESTSMGAFFQDQITLLDGQLLLTPGVRYDKFEASPKTDTTFTPPAEIGQELTDHDSDKFTFRLGAVYKLTDVYSLFGNYSQGFKSPEVIDTYYGSYRNYGPYGTYLSLPNPELKPEESDSFEMGFRVNNDLGSLQISAFHNNYTDFIESVTLDNVYNGVTYSQVSQNVNIDEVTIQGVELQGSLWLDNAFGAPMGTSLQASIAYADGENDTNDEPLNSISPLKGVFGLSYDAPSNTWGSTLNWTLVDKKDSSDIADETGAATHGYGIVDLSLYYNIGEHLSLRGGLYNLTDKKYSQWEDVRGLTDTTNLDTYTQPGRNLSLSATYAF